jgi:hypothetical protein
MLGRWAVLCCCKWKWTCGFSAAGAETPLDRCIRGRIGRHTHSDEHLALWFGFHQIKMQASFSPLYDNISDWYLLGVKRRVSHVLDFSTLWPFTAGDKLHKERIW